MDKTFEKAYDIVLNHEGGYANDPDDPGGETYKGIARGRWRSWQGWHYVDAAKNSNSSTKEINAYLATIPEVQRLVKSFYKEHFWDAVWGDNLANLDEDLAIDMFDMAVNLGTGRAVEFIQEACNALNNRQKLYTDIPVDRSFGGQTMKAIQFCIDHRGSALLYKVINLLQGNWYLTLMKRDDKFEKYIGWFNRVNFKERK